MKKFLLVFFIALLFQTAYSQCRVTTSANPATIRCGQSAFLSAFGQSTGTVILNETFNTSSFGPGWGSTPGSVSFSNPCSPGGVDGTPHAWMSNATSVPRTLNSSPYNLTSATAGVTVCFDLLYATQGNAAPCEGPDEPDEGVYLQYSTDNGVTWNTIHYFDPNGGYDSQLTNWNNWCFPLPAGAITSNTIIRWHQIADSGADYDHWGIDNVQIYQNDINSTLVWLHDGYSYGTGNPGGVNPNAVSPTTTTTYTAQLTTGTGVVCTDVVTVTVLPPVFDVNISATPNPLCTGQCANITATAQEVLSPHTTPTFTNNQIDLVTSGNASVNINVQGLNTTSLTSSSITSVNISSFQFSGSSLCTNFGGCPCNGGSISLGQTCNLNTSGFTVTLTSPGGCSITLVPAGVATGNYSNTTFVPSGGSPQGGTFPNGGTWAPNQPFSNLNGCNPNGVWTLTFNAPGLGIGTGFLTGWSISFDDPAIYGPVTYAWSPTTNMTGSTTLTPTVCPTVTTVYSLTVANPHAGCPTYTESINIPVSSCTVCTPPPIVVTQPAPVCAPGTVNLASTISGAGTSVLSYYTNGVDANAGTNPLASSIVSTSGVYYVRAEVAGSTPPCSTVASITVTINPIVTVSATGTPLTICPGASSTLTASGGTSYTWNGPGGFTSTANPVTVSPTTTSTYTVTSIGCPGTLSASVTVTVSPAAPVIGTITGPTTLCPNATAITYTITNHAGSTYNWTVPAGATITSGQGTNSINVDFGATGGNIAVTETSTCGTGNATLAVNISSTPLTSAITGLTPVCPNATNVAYSVINTAGSTYNWTVPAGAIIMSGQGTNSITVNFGPNGGNIDVTETASCGTGNSTLAVTISTTPVTSAITGPTTVCPNATGIVYSVTNTAGSTYNWSVPAGSTIVSGQNTNSITVNFGATGGTISVTETSACGTGTPVTTVITTSAVPVTSAITGLTPMCVDAALGQVYSVVNTVGSTYVWTVPAGATITGGQTTNAITVNFGATGGTISVTETSTCGAGAPVTLNVVVNPLPTITVTSTTVCVGQSASITASGASTYTWNTGASGATLTISPATVPSTTYTATGMDANGCVNTGTGIVATNPLPIITVTSTTVCAGQSANIVASGASTYTWNTGASGATLTINPATAPLTVYTATGTDVNGCINTGTGAIATNSLPIITVSSISVCAGQSASIIASGASSYTWNTGASGATLTVNPATAPSTVYTATGTDINGCVSTGTGTITVNPLPTITATSATVCSGQSATITASGTATNYLWNTGTSTAALTINPVTTTTMYTVVGTIAATTCTATATGTITVNPLPMVTATAPATVCTGNSATLTAAGASTYTWTPGSITTNPLTVSPTITTVYTVQGEDGNNCRNSAIVTVVVNPLPPVTVTSVTVCSGNSTSITASGANTYTWANTPVTGSNFIINPAPAVSSSTPYTYTVTGTDANGCSNSATGTVTVNPLPVVTANLVSGSLPNVCLGSTNPTSTIVASGAVNYSWQPATSLNTSSGPSVVASPTINTTYTVTGTNALGCANTAMLTITATPQFTVNISPNNFTICQGESVTIQATGADSYVWANNTTNFISNDPPVNSNVTVNPTSTHLYFVTGIKNGCNDFDTLSVTVLPAITANAGSNDTICFGESVNLSGITSINGQTYLWTSTTDNSLTTPANVLTSATPSITSNYTLTVSHNGLCPDTDVVSVVVLPIPDVYAGQDTTINVEDVVVLNGYSNVLTYSWENSSTLNCLYCLSPAANPIETTTYVLTATNQYNCKNSDEVVVTVTQEYALYVPSAFSPNDDLINELWQPKGFGIEKIQIYVYDRWGMKLFEAKDLKTAWDGTFKGNTVQQDVYVYKINAEAYSGARISKVGHVTVVK